MKYHLNINALTALILYICVIVALSLACGISPTNAQDTPAQPTEQVVSQRPPSQQTSTQDQCRSQLPDVSEQIEMAFFNFDLALHHLRSSLIRCYTHLGVEEVKQDHPASAELLFTWADQLLEKADAALQASNFPPFNQFNRDEIALALESDRISLYVNQSSLLSTKAEQHVESGNYRDATIARREAFLLEKKIIQSDKNSVKMAKSMGKSVAAIQSQYYSEARKSLYYLATINLAQAYREQGTNELAEPLIKEYQDYLQESYTDKQKTPSEHIRAHFKLSTVYQTNPTAEDLEQAEKIQTDLLLYAQTHFGEGSLEVAQQLYELGAFYLGQSDDEAEKHLQRSIEIYRQHNSPHITNPQGILASAYVQRFAATGDKQTLIEIIKLNNKIYKTQHASAELFKKEMANTPYEIKQADKMEKLLSAAYLNSMANAHWNAEEFGQAYQLLEKNLADDENTLPPGNPGSKTYSWEIMAVVQRKEGKFKQALESIQQAYASYEAHPNDSEEFANSLKGLGFQHLATLRDGLEQGKLTRDEVIPAAFYAAQVAHGYQRSQTLQKLALQKAAANRPEISAKLQQRWDAQAELKRLEASQPQVVNNNTSPAALEQLHEKIAKTQEDIRKLERELQAEFPAYQALTSHRPLPLEQAQALLQPDEALMIWVENSVNVTWKKSYSYLLVVRNDRPPSLHKLDMNQRRITDDVETLRQALTLSEGETQPKAFDLGLANGLYAALFAPAEADLAGVKHIIAEQDPAMHNLPLHVLVKTPTPSTTPTSNAAYAEADWLVRHYSFAYLPAVQALADLRANAAATPPAPQMLLGFGNPLLQGDQALTRESALRALNEGQKITNGTGFIEDTRELKKYQPLTDTAVELQTIAKLLGADPDTSLYLGDKATESMVKELNQQGQLATAKIVEFATHASLAKQRLFEAGLLLTPPDRGTITDDGYLSASEVASLDLNAEWVLLSACNTGTLTLNDTQAGVSELSKAFFIAGARSVLASLWSVNSSATAQLMPRLFSQLQDQPNLRRDQALQQAMLATLEGSWFSPWLRKLGIPAGQPLAHPVYWAPFVIYGEGGEVRGLGR